MKIASNDIKQGKNITFLHLAIPLISGMLGLEAAEKILQWNNNELTIRIKR